ncbi:MAG: EamA family transporter, partial [Deinococcota bacterium]
GQRAVSAAEASLIYALEPVTATLFSFLLIGERVGLRGALGGLLVVAATMLSQRAGGEPQLETPAPQAKGREAS